MKSFVFTTEKRFRGRGEGSSLPELTFLPQVDEKLGSPAGHIIIALSAKDVPDVFVGFRLQFLVRADVTKPHIALGKWSGGAFEVSFPADK